MEDQALKERYAKAALILADLLRIQEVFIPSGKAALVEQGRVNAKALGYIYGLADCALQIGKMDIGSNWGLGLLMSLIVEFDDANGDMLWQYLQKPADEDALMEGVSLGFDDYAVWAKSGGNGGPPLRWRECFSK